MKVVNLTRKLMIGAAILVGSLANFAFADDSSISNLAGLEANVSENAGTVFQIVMIVATLGGLILIIKGLVHLKQNYSGSSQEKHMSKGIASLGFGTALILAIPLSHMLVGTVGTSTTFNTGVSNVDFSQLSGAANPQG